MFNFFNKKNKIKNTLDMISSSNESNFSLPPNDKLKKQSILDVVDNPSKTYDDYVTNELLSGLSDFRKNTPEFNHYRQEILDILNSEGGEKLLYEQLGKTINNKI